MFSDFGPSFVTVSHSVPLQIHGTYWHIYHYLPTFNRMKINHSCRWILWVRAFNVDYVDLGMWMRENLLVCQAMRFGTWTPSDPIASMYGISTYIWLIFMVNVGKYTIHGWYGDCQTGISRHSFLEKLVSGWNRENQGCCQPENNRKIPLATIIPNIIHLFQGLGSSIDGSYLLMAFSSGKTHQVEVAGVIPFLAPGFLYNPGG